MTRDYLRQGTGWGSRLAATFAAAILLMSVSRLEGGTASAGARQGLRLVSVKPTVLFTPEQGALAQVAEVVIENNSEPTEAALEVKLGSKAKTTILGLVKKGQTTHTVGVPDIKEPVRAAFVLRVGGRETARLSRRWEPQRHWEIYMVPITHHDLGYTDTIEGILNRYDGYYDDILRFCQETDDWPDESKYRYTVEGAWSIQHYIENSGEETRAKLRKYIQQGRIDIGALFGNEISALCSHEELIRLMYPSFRIKRDYGASIETGSITDVPGLSWGRHVVVFNPLSFERTDVVTVSKFGKPDGLDVVDLTTGKKVPYQIVTLDGPQACVPYAAYRYARGQFDSDELYDLVFVAEKVPAMGYKTYRLVEKETADSFKTGISVTGESIENRFFKVTLDAKTGAVARIYDKQLQRELVDKGSPYRANQYLAKWVQTGQIDSTSDVVIRQGCVGPVCGSLVAEGRGAGCPQLRQEVVLYDKIKRIDFNNRLLKDSTPLLEIYFAFPFAVENPDFRFEGTDSVIKPLRDQFPGSNTNYYAVQHWADVSDGTMGITLSAIESHLLAFGGLWPCYVSPAHHGVRPPDFGEPFVGAEQMTKGYMYAFAMDSNFQTNFQPVQQGDMLFRYSITTHPGNWRAGRPRDFGWSIGNRLEAIVLDGRQAGPLGSSQSFCAVDKPNVFVLMLKGAEDGDGLIVRLIETEGKAVTAQVTLPGLNIRRAWLTNIVEENQRELAAKPHTLEVSLRAFGITTIRIQAE